MKFTSLGMQSACAVWQTVILGRSENPFRFINHSSLAVNSSVVVTSELAYSCIVLRDKRRLPPSISQIELNKASLMSVYRFSSSSALTYQASSLSFWLYHSVYKRGQRLFEGGFYTRKYGMPIQNSHVLIAATGIIYTFGYLLVVNVLSMQWSNSEYILSTSHNIMVKVMVYCMNLSVGPYKFLILYF